MVQMGAETTTVTEADMSRQEMDQMNDTVRKHETDGEKKSSQLPESKQEIIWSNVILITLLHVLAIRGLLYLPYTKYQSIIFGKYPCIRRVSVTDIREAPSLDKRPSDTRLILPAFY